MFDAVACSVPRGGSRKQRHSELPRCNQVPKWTMWHFITTLPDSRVFFAREGEDVLVARSRQEKDVVVDCLF